jgi:hypothetical protein
MTWKKYFFVLSRISGSEKYTEELQTRKDRTCSSIIPFYVCDNPGKHLRLDEPDTSWEIGIPHHISNLRKSGDQSV